MINKYIKKERTVESCIGEDTKNFWSKVNKKKKNDCWQWTGQLNGTGRAKRIEK